MATANFSDKYTLRLNSCVIMELDSGVPEDEDCKKRRRKRQKLLIIDLFFDFAKNTSLHGLRYMSEVGLTIVEKVFWVLTFLISVSLCFFLIERVYHRWLYSPVIVSFNERMVPVGEVPFPSITICPQWKCKSSAYNYTDKLKKLVYGPRDASNASSYDENAALEDAFLVCSGVNTYFIGSRNTSNDSLVKNIINIAPMLNESIVMCTWRGMKVPCEDYFKEVLTKEGVCYNFNALSYNDIFKEENVQREYKYLKSDIPIHKWDIITGYATDINDTRENQTGDNREQQEEFPRRAQENGPLPDFQILLLENSTDVDDSCNSLANGWKIYLQHPADMPQASLYYYAATPGQLTSLALKFSVIDTSETLISYRPEQRQCYFPRDRELEYFATYTPDNCRLECLSKYTYEKCDCVWFHMPHSNSSEICTARKRLCVKKAQAELATNTHRQNNCNCLPSCNSVHYDAEILKATLDLTKYANAMKKLQNYTVPNQDGYSRLELYFKEPQFVSMRRSELFGLTEFLANCGGLLGLFLGFSVLSLIEMFYFCTLRLWCTLKKDINNEKKEIEENLEKKKQSKIAQISANRPLSFPNEIPVNN